MFLKGKHALVSGGGTGIGLAIAQRLASEGAVVTITGRRAEVLRKAAESEQNLEDRVMDVGDPDSVRDGVGRSVAAHGPIQICVANAGIAEGRHVLKTSNDFWRSIMQTNLDGCFYTIKESLSSVPDGDWARVIAISSIAGVKGLKGASAYSASKHGMIGLIRGMAADYVGTQVTCNAICPAYVDTDIVPDNIQKIMARTGMDESAARDVMLSANPHGRLIDPSEIAATALWLCSPGSESVNGQAIQVAGGEF